MNCTEIQEMMSVFVDGELSPGDDEVMFRHTGTCSECQHFFRSLMSIRQTVTVSALHEPAHEFDTRIMMALASTQTSLQRGPLGHKTLPISVAASIAAILIVVSFVLSPVLIPIDTRSKEQTTEITSQDMPTDAHVRLERYLR